MDIDFYRGRLRSDKYALDDELEKQGELQERISREVSRLEARYEMAEDTYQGVKARLFQDCMREAAERSVKAPTVDQANAWVRRHPERTKAWERRAAALAELRDWQNLLEAWKVKGFTLRDLGLLYGADYFSLTQTSVRRDAAQDIEREVRDLGERRAGIREASARADKRERRAL